MINITNFSETRPDVLRRDELLAGRGAEAGGMQDRKRPRNQGQLKNLRLNILVLTQ